MKHETLPLSFSSQPAFAGGFDPIGRTSQPPAKGPIHSSQAMQNWNDRPAAQEVELVEEQPGRLAPLNPNLFPLLLAIRRFKEGGALVRFA